MRDAHTSMPILRREIGHELPELRSILSSCAKGSPAYRPSTPVDRDLRAISEGLGHFGSGRLCDCIVKQKAAKTLDVRHTVRTEMSADSKTAAPRPPSLRFVVHWYWHSRQRGCTNLVRDLAIEQPMPGMPLEFIHASERRPQ